MSLSDRVGASWRGCSGRGLDPGRSRPGCVGLTTKRCVFRLVHVGGALHPVGYGRPVRLGYGLDELARNLARARLNWFSQGQRCGRCRVSWRAERVSRPAREKKRRRRVLVVTSCSPRPIARCPASQVVGDEWCVAGSRAGRLPGPGQQPRLTRSSWRTWPHRKLRRKVARMAFSISAWRQRWSAASRVAGCPQSIGR